MQIHEAAARGDLAALAQQLARGVAIDSREAEKGYTPLMSAAASADAGPATLRFLLAQGAGVNACGWTPTTAPAEALAQVSADHATYQFSGETALTLAASRGDLACLEALLDAGADVRATTTHGYDALINAVYASGAHPDRAAPLVALLLARGASPTQATAYGETALKVASHQGLFDVVALLLDAGADRSSLGWTPLMEAVVFGSLADVRALLDASADVEARDRWDRTALHLSVQLGDLAKAQLLRAHGAALLVPSRLGPASPLGYALAPSHAEMLAWLLREGCSPDPSDSEGDSPLKLAAAAGATGAVEQLLGAGAAVNYIDQYGEPAIAFAKRREVVELLLAAGADPNQINDAMRQELFGFGAEAPLVVTPHDYYAAKHRRFGQANPEAMDVPFWHAMIRARVSAYAARTHIGEGWSCDDGAVWCFDRFGRTLTILPNGRYVEIAGEHEDYYDPDFCIYNDVVVYEGDGTCTLYGYPQEVFPPTDFHTATLVGQEIYIIGSLGYRGSRRFGETPVYRLSCVDWAITPLATQGEQPGWISRHAVHYDAAANRIVVSGGKRCLLAAPEDANAAAGGTDGGLVEHYLDNANSYALDLTTLTWRRLS